MKFLLSILFLCCFILAGVKVAEAGDRAVQRSSSRTVTKEKSSFRASAGATSHFRARARLNVRGSTSGYAHGHAAFAGADYGDVVVEERVIIRERKATADGHCDPALSGNAYGFQTQAGSCGTAARSAADPYVSGGVVVERERVIRRARARGGY